MDFAVGMSLFIGIVLFIFLFVPGILDPFTMGAQDETVTSNRVADSLTQSLLASPERPGELSQRCTVLFFGQADFGGDDVDKCGFSGKNVSAFLGLDRRQQVNVSIAGNVSATDAGTDPLCWNTAAEELAEVNDSSDCDLRLAAGDRPTRDNVDAVTATRVATLDGTDVTLTVEMW